MGSQPTGKEKLMRRKLTCLGLGFALSVAAFVSGVKPAEASNCVTNCSGDCCSTCCQIGFKWICTYQPC
jgi:hypothetical protein